jgi:para-aminobenzoate synthetase / 4-amino-4-deoxychorismate lyase
MAHHDPLGPRVRVDDPRAGGFELLETLRFDGAALHNRERHLRRLADSAEQLGFRCDLAVVSTALDQSLVVGSPASRVRLLLRRDGSTVVRVDELPHDDAAAPALPPVLLALDDEPVDPAEWWLYHKTSLREPYDGRRARRPDVDDVIMVSSAGQLTEVTRATLAVRLSGRWWTPPVTSGCLPGAERARLIEDGTLEERVLWPTDLARAEGLAAINSLRGWRAARLIGRATTPG